MLLYGSSSPTSLQVVDGLPSPFFLQPNTTYSLTYPNPKLTKANIAISSKLHLLSRLRIKFTEKVLNEHYHITPRFKTPFHSSNLTHAQQTFQIDQTGQDIAIEMHLTGEESGGWF